MKEEEKLDKLLTQEEIEAIQQAIKEMADEKLEDAWEDFDLMYQDMKEHAKNNGYNIGSADSLPSSFGWVCFTTGKTWSITFKNWKKWLEKQNQLSQDTFKLTFRSAEGRKVFCDMINRH